MASNPSRFEIAADNSAVASELLVSVPPKDGSLYTVSDTIVISWEYRDRECDDYRFMTVPRISVNSGKTYKEIFIGSVRHETTSYDTFWIVLDDPAYITDEVRFEVYNYDKILLRDESENFTIQK